jgi:hypothetical protein
VIKALKWIAGLLGLLLGGAGTALWLRRKPAASAADAKRAAADASRRAEKARHDAQDLASLETRQDRTETKEQQDADDVDLGGMLDRLDAGARARPKR